MQSQVHLPQLSPLNKMIIIVMAAFFLLSSVAQLAAGVSLLSWLALSLNGLKAGLVHTLVTFPLIEPHLLGVLFQGLILWFLGSELEFSFGPRRYLMFIGTCLLGALVSFLAVSLVSTGGAWLAGMGAVSVGLCVAYALMHPDRPFIFMLLFPMKAKYFCLLLAGVSLYQGLLSGSKAQAVAQLGAMLFAWAFMAKVYGLSGIDLSKMRNKSPKSRRSSHLKLVKKDRDDENPPKYWH